MDPKSRYEQERLKGKQSRLITIVEAAERVFTLKGIEKTTMQDIANDANIGIATLFRYFPKKERLIVAVANKLLEPILHQFQSIAGLPLTCLEKLERLFDFFIEDHNNPSITFMVDFESYASHSLEPLEGIQDFEALNRKIAREYLTIIQNGLEDGSIRSDISVQDTLTTVLNTFGLFSRKLSLRKNILLLESDLTSDFQLQLLKKILIDYLRP
ncbi:TetR/AcrR family transcriptional regulator [Paenibacillus puerhi]|uniref:TetR/AcrR family transcriptional regulator n=1 Tax=Paenibacillus puerhi TaxID=2692622 RepID=UPI001356E685|nr:TetR/AcrR family transcriptional regulator [Paenibacillus puerhi]